MTPGVVFSIEDLGFPKEWWENVRVKLSRMVAKGVINKLSKGRFYRPRISFFGTMAPDFNELVKDLVRDDAGQPIGYLTSYSVWNNMALTTQVSNVVIIGTNVRRNPITRNRYTIRFLLQPNKITNDNIPLLQILDTIKLIKQIPDTTIASSIHGIKDMLSNLSNADIALIIQLALKYPPRVRALLGVMLEDLGYNKAITPLRSSLNPGSVYKFGIVDTDGLINQSKWNIE